MDQEHICPECGFHNTHFKSWHQEGEPIVTIIGFWPVEERGMQGFDNRWISRCHYRTACAHAHYNLQIIESPDQAFIQPGADIICLEEPHEIDDIIAGTFHSSAKPPKEVIELSDFIHPRNATYILGNTYFQRPSDHFEANHLVGITMDDTEIAQYSPLYGSQVATLIWYDRKLKGIK